MSIDATLSTIGDLIADLKETYELQAELVSTEIANQESVISGFKRYQCVSWPFCPSGGYSSDSEPGDLARFWHTIEENDHPDQGEAREQVEAAAEEYNTTETAQMDQQEELSTIPTDLGGFLQAWVAIDSSFANIYYPANTNEIPSSGETWLSTASGGYDSAVGTQRTAADTARSVTGDLISNSAAFLSKITDTMGSFTDLALQQEQLYVDALSSLAQDYTSIGGYISAAKELAQLMQDQRQLYYDRVSEQGQLLASAVESVIQTTLLESDLDGIGPGGAWPDPQNVATNKDNPAQPPQDEIITDATWFGRHIAYWDDMTSDMGELKASAEAAPVLPIKIIELPHFSAVQSTALNGLADSLTTAIGQGKDAAAKMSNGLTTTIRNYINNEIGAGAEADAFFNKHVTG